MHVVKDELDARPTVIDRLTSEAAGGGGGVLYTRNEMRKR